MLSESEVNDAVASLQPSKWEGIAYRHTAKSFSPLSTEGARLFGGRWNPIGVDALYLAATPAGAYAEFVRMVEYQGRLLSDFPRDLHTISVPPLDVIDLTSVATLAAVGLSLQDVAANDQRPCQFVAEAILARGLQGLLAPSAAGVELVVIAAYPAAARLNAFTVITSEDLHSWHEKQRQ